MPDVEVYSGLALCRCSVTVEVEYMGGYYTQWHSNEHVGRNEYVPTNPTVLRYLEAPVLERKKA
jgi:hypothetical protein